MRLLAAAGPSNNDRVDVIQTLWRALMGMILAGLLAAPAAAWDRHALAHLNAPVDASVHHHHEGDGSIAIDHHHDDGADKGSDGDEDSDGHDHMPSLTAAWTGLLAGGPLLILPQLAGTPTMSVAARAPPDIPLDPQIRPPRSA